MTSVFPCVYTPYLQKVILKFFSTMEAEMTIWDYLRNYRLLAQYSCGDHIMCGFFTTHYHKLLLPSNHTPESWVGKIGKQKSLQASLHRHEA